MDVQELLGKVAQHLSVSRAFGTAYEKDGSLVIPVALVAGGGGGGEGGPGSPTVPDEGDVDGSESASEATSTGSGGGFGGVVMPVGVYVVKGEKIRWVPAVNANLVIVVAFLTLRMIARSRRRARRRTS
ncbi:MAG: spore germination protein GerW family protein [Acidimicrobiales bacterium]